MRICSSINQSKWEIQQCQSSSAMIDNWKHAIEWVLLETELGRKKIRFLRHSNVESKEARKRKSKETTKKTRRYDLAKTREIGYHAISRDENAWIVNTWSTDSNNAEWNLDKMFIKLCTKIFVKTVLFHSEVGG